MSKHKTVTLDLDGCEEEIDEKIAPLIKKLWELEIRTSNSCEDNVPEGWVWIEFWDTTNAEKFLNIVAEYSEDRNSLYNRIRQEWDSENDELFWKYSVLPMDCGVSQTIIDDTVEEKFTGECDFTFSFSIRFPQSDLKEIINRLNEK